MKLLINIKKCEIFWNVCGLLRISELYRNSTTTSDFFYYFIVWLSGAEPSSHWGCCPRLTLRPQSDIIGALSTLHMWQKNLHSRLCFACCYISTLRFQISVHSLHWRGMRISISGYGRELELNLTRSVVSLQSHFRGSFFILLRCHEFILQSIKNWNILQYVFDFDKDLTCCVLSFETSQNQ